MYQNSTKNDEFDHEKSSKFKEFFPSLIGDDTENKFWVVKDV